VRTRRILLSAVLLGAGVGGCSSAHRSQTAGLRPARTHAALIAAAGIPPIVGAWMPWSHDPPHRLGSHRVHRAAQGSPVGRSPASAVPATSALRLTARPSPAAASRPVHSWSFAEHSSTRSVTSADGTTTKTVTKTTTRTVDGKTTRTTHTQTTTTPPRAGTHPSPAGLGNGHLTKSTH
jgi:hypothetical protein